MTLTTVTARAARAATVSRLLNKAGIRKSETSKGRVSTYTSEGFQTTQQGSNVLIKYEAGDSTSNWEVFETFRAGRIESIKAVLTTKGYELEGEK